MRILFLSPWFPYPRDNGSKSRVHYLLRSLSEQHEITLAAFAFGSADPGEAVEIKKMCKAVFTIPADPIAINQSTLIRNFISPSPTSARPISSMSQLVKNLLEKQCFDLVIASTDVMISYALLAPENRLKMLELHNSLSRWMLERYKGQNWGINRLRCWASWIKMKSYERRTYSKFEKITMVSEIDAQETIAGSESLRKLISVVPNGVDTAFYYPQSLLTQPYSLIYTGNLGYRPNYDAMLFFARNVLPLIEKEIPEVQLTITGSIENINIEIFSPNENIHFSGYVDDIRPLVSSSSVSVVPILDGGGTRIKVLEAMALGTPVVATQKAVEGLMLKSGVHLLVADAPAEFANMVVSLLRNDVLSGTIAKNGRKLVEDKYDWRNIGQEFLRIVEGCRADFASKDVSKA